MIPWTLLTCSLWCGVVVAEVFWQMKFTNRRQVDVAKNWTLYCQSFSSMSKQTAEGLDAWIHLLSRSITKIFIQSYQLDLWILLWSFFCCLGQYCGWWCRISRLGTTTTTAQGARKKDVRLLPGTPWAGYIFGDVKMESGDIKKPQLSLCLASASELRSSAVWC